MRLLNPTPGEACNRQTILKIMMEDGEKTKTNTVPYIDEHRAIQKYLEVNWFLLTRREMSDKFNKLMENLETVNRGIYHFSQVFKTVKNGSTIMNTIADTALAMLELNHQRNSLIRSINELFGIQATEPIIFGL